ncbi:putative membrane protein [Catenulispora sp. GP43]|uniref:DUF2254 domain-containing protein n=1 Tax=Catenulispora sp. GP43 TaxID=3156263 RepID=UPI003511FCE4
MRFDLRSEWRREALRTNLWLVPAFEVAGAVLLFVFTYTVDRAVYRGAVRLPFWVISGTADASRQILTTIAAAVITVIGVVFSVMIVALTLASTQFGPRMLRNFMRDRGTQWTLGTFVATFVYAVLALIAIGPGPHGDFVPHVSITSTLILVIVDLAVLLYFIHHIAVQIQLPQVIASIAGDVAKAIEAEAPPPRSGRPERGLSEAELLSRMAQEPGEVKASASGYLQYVRHSTLIRIATSTNSVIHLLHRPGHFLVKGRTLAVVWPAEAAPGVAKALQHAHLSGAYRSLSQDISFGIDQLVEIAIRALSPAVNDTFTALTCIDWIGDSLREIALLWRPEQVHRDAQGYIRVITTQTTFDRLVQRSFEKIRQAAAGMPAVMIRQLDALTEILEQAPLREQRGVLMEQAEMIRTLCVETVGEKADREDVLRRYDVIAGLHASRVDRDR